MSNVESLKGVLEPEVVERLLLLSPTSRLRRLRDLAKALPSKSAELTAVQDVVVHLWQEVRETSADLREPVDHISPSEFDVMLLDLHPEDLTMSIAKVLEIPYLGAASAEAIWPATGIVWGHNARSIIAMPCKSQDRDKKFGKPLWVHFIADTGSPYTYLAPEALDALSDYRRHPDHIDRQKVWINGVATAVEQTPDHNGTPTRPECHFRGLNILGTDFYTRTRSTRTVNYDSMVIELAKPAN